MNHSSLRKIYSVLIVIIQFFLIIFLMVSGKVIPDSVILLALEIIPAIFGLWAMAEMRFRFNVFPEVLEGTSLVTSGPFRFVRHPIYASGIFILLVWIINDFSFIRLTAWIILAGVLNVKIVMEEKILCRDFPEYTDYMKKTKKLIPFIF